MITRQESLVNRILALQPHSLECGLFCSRRVNKSLGYSRPDDTVFPSAVIAFTLGTLRNRISPKLHANIDLLINRVVACYPEFQNKEGLGTYNFWRTNPSRHFPNGYIFRRFRHFSIPDDADDTVMVYLTSNKSLEEKLWLKQKLSQHANGVAGEIKNTFPEYRDLRAYSTWFGKRMYIEFDACVLSNVMYWVLDSDLELNQHDEDSLSYIQSVVLTGKYISNPFRCAHQYPNTALIAYHISRLLGKFDISGFDSVRQKLKEDLLGMLKSNLTVPERVLISTSLLRLGVVPDESLLPNASISDFSAFNFFIAGLLTAYESPSIYYFASNSVFHMGWQCEALSTTLLLEYEILRKNEAIS